MGVGGNISLRLLAFDAHRVWTPWHALWLLTPLPYAFVDRLTYVAGAEACNAESFSSGFAEVALLFIMISVGVSGIAYAALFVGALVALVRAQNWTALTAWLCIPALMLAGIRLTDWDLLRFAFHSGRYEALLQKAQAGFTLSYEVEPCMYFGGAPFNPYSRILFERTRAADGTVVEHLPENCASQGVRRLAWTNYFVAECPQ